MLNFDSRYSAILRPRGPLYLRRLQGDTLSAKWPIKPCPRKSGVEEQSADHVLALKGNQEILNEDVRLFLDNPATPVAQATKASKGHDRVSTRTASISGDVAWLQGIYHWPT